MKKVIRLISDDNNLNLMDRAKSVYIKQKYISSLIDEYNWFIPDSIPIDIREENNTIQKIINYFKEIILSADRGKKDISENYLSPTKSTIAFSLCKSFEKFKINYSIGKILEYMPFEVLTISNYQTIGSFNNYNNSLIFFKKLVKYIKPKHGCITDDNFYLDIVDADPHEIWTGGITYISSEFNFNNIPHDFEIENVNDIGQLIITTRELFNSKKEEHAIKAKLLMDYFRKNM